MPAIVDVLDLDVGLRSHRLVMWVKPDAHIRLRSVA